MALQICATAEKKIIINGTTVEIPSVYNRLEFVARADGKTMEVAGILFQDEDFYNRQEPIACDVVNQNLNVTLAKGEIQDLKMAEKYAAKAYEEAGYIVSIVE
jgi:hypothetical protein